MFDYPLKITEVLCGFASNEGHKDSGGIQNVEISFITSASKLCNNIFLSLVVGSGERKVIKKNHSLKIYEIPVTNYTRVGGIIDTWPFSLDALGIVSRNILNGEHVVHYNSVGPASAFINGNYKYFKNSKKINTIFAYTLHNSHYALSDEPHDIFKLYPQEWNYLHDEEVAIIEEADLVMSTSRRLSKLLSSKFNKKIEYMPNTLGMLKDYKITKMPQFNQYKICLSMNRMEKEKNLLTTLKASIDIFRSDSDFRFIFAGLGSQKTEMKRLLADYNIKFYDRNSQDSIEECIANIEESKVIFTGQVYGDEKEKLFNISDIFVQPSFRETFPVVGMESLIYGKIMVGSDIPGWLDYKDYGATVFISDPYDKDSIRYNINQALNICGTDTQEQIHNQHRKIYIENFEAPVIVQKRIDLFKKYVNSSIYRIKKNE